MQGAAKSNYNWLWVSVVVDTMSMVNTTHFSTNNWKSNDNLASVKAFNRHPQYDAARIDYDYGFIELVSCDLMTTHHFFCN